MTTTTDRPATAVGHPEAAFSARQPIQLPEDWELTDERFEEVCRLNPLSRFERTADGRLFQLNASREPVPRFEALINAYITMWALTFGGSARGNGQYNFVDAQTMIPDGSWVTQQVLDQRVDRSAFFTEAPALVVEVASMYDDIHDQQRKMAEWITRGTLLGWLVDPWNETVFVYRSGGEVEQLERPSELSGEDVCPGLVVPMQPLWNIEA